MYRIENTYSFHPQIISKSLPQATMQLNEKLKQANEIPVISANNQIFEKKNLMGPSNNNLRKSEQSTQNMRFSADMNVQERNEIWYRSKEK
jgi:hypothetical protein